MTRVAPAKVRKEAKLGLMLHKKWKRGGTAVGVARAVQLSSGKAVSDAVIKRMYSYFQRHQHDRLDKDGSDGSIPGRGYIAWLLWGGYSGRKWAEAEYKKIKKTKNPISKSVKKIKEDLAQKTIYLLQVTLDDYRSEPWAQEMVTKEEDFEVVDNYTDDGEPIFRTIEYVLTVLPKKYLQDFEFLRRMQVEGKLEKRSFASAARAWLENDQPLDWFNEQAQDRGYLTKDEYLFLVKVNNPTQEEKTKARKEYFIELAKECGTRPSNDTKEGQQLSSFLNFDPTFKKKIKELCPQWFGTKRGPRKETLELMEKIREMARRGDKRPSDNSKDPNEKKLGLNIQILFRLYPDFKNEIFEIDPRWSLEGKKDIIAARKEYFIELAKECGTRPQSDTKDGKQFRGFLLTDPVFKKKVKELCPQWFRGDYRLKEETLELMETIREMARRGDKRPLINSENHNERKLARMVRDIFSRYPNFRDEILGINRDWFKSEERKYFAEYKEENPHKMSNPARNVANVEDVKIFCEAALKQFYAYLHSSDDRPEMDKWFKSNFFKGIMNSERTSNLFREVKSKEELKGYYAIQARTTSITPRSSEKVPDFALKNIDEGKEILFFIGRFHSSPDFFYRVDPEYIHTMAHFVNFYLSGDFPADPSRVSFDQMIDLIRQWDEKDVKVSDESKIAEGEVVFKEYSDGMKWVLLTNKQAIENESRISRMAHCIGKISQNNTTNEYIDMVVDGVTRKLRKRDARGKEGDFTSKTEYVKGYAFSLRDKENNSYVTCFYETHTYENNPEQNQGYFSEIKGYKNCHINTIVYHQVDIKDRKGIEKLTCFDFPRPNSNEKYVIDLIRDKRIEDLTQCKHDMKLTSFCQDLTHTADFVTFMIVPDYRTVDLNDDFDKNLESYILTNEEFERFDLRKLNLPYAAIYEEKYNKKTKFPPNLTVFAPMDFETYNIKELPDNLKIIGDLFLDKDTEKVGDGIVVEGELAFTNDKKALADKIKAQTKKSIVLKEKKYKTRNPVQKLYLFSYGSNNPDQLAERLERKVKTKGAYAEDMARIFVGHSRKWNGAVASIERQEGKKVYGLVAEVTEADLKKMDVFEGVASGKYKRKKIKVTLQSGEEVSAIAYIASDSTRGRPSREYLEAVAKTISAHWKGSRGEDVKVSDIKTNNPLEIIARGFDERPASAYDREELKLGVKTELEHTDDAIIASKIAKDHLDEHPHYYSKLVEMEKGMKKSNPAWGDNPPMIRFVTIANRLSYTLTAILFYLNKKGLRAIDIKKFLESFFSTISKAHGKEYKVTQYLLYEFFSEYSSKNLIFKPDSNYKLYNEEIFNRFYQENILPTKKFLITVISFMDTFLSKYPQTKKYILKNPKRMEFINETDHGHTKLLNEFIGVLIILLLLDGPSRSGQLQEKINSAFPYVISPAEFFRIINQLIEGGDVIKIYKHQTRHTFYKLSNAAGTLNKYEKDFQCLYQICAKTIEFIEDFSEKYEMERGMKKSNPVTPEADDYVSIVQEVVDAEGNGTEAWIDESTGDILVGNMAFEEDRSFDDVLIRIKTSGRILEGESVDDSIRKYVQSLMKKIHKDLVSYIANKKSNPTDKSDILNEKELLSNDFYYSLTRIGILFICKNSSEPLDASIIAKSINELLGKKIALSAVYRELHVLMDKKLVIELGKRKSKTDSSAKTRIIAHYSISPKGKIALNESIQKLGNLIKSLSSEKKTNPARQISSDKLSIIKSFYSKVSKKSEPSGEEEKKSNPVPAGVDPEEFDELVKQLKKRKDVDNPYALANFILKKKIQSRKNT